MSKERVKKDEVRYVAGAGVESDVWFKPKTAAEEAMEETKAVNKEKPAVPVEIVEPVETGMPDFSVLNGEDIKVMTPEEVKRVKAEDENWKKFALGAGDKLAEIEIAKMQIERVGTEGFSPTLQKKLQKLEAKEEGILSRLLDNEEAMGRAMFDKPLKKMELLAELVRSDEIELSDDEVQQYLLTGYTEGRLEKMSRDAAVQARKERESNLIFWGWSTYRLVPDPPEKVSQPNKAFLTQLRPLVNAVVAQRRRQEEEQNEQKEPEEVSVTLEKMKAMKANSSKYSLLDIAQGAKVPPAKIVFAEIEPYETKKGRKYEGDCFTVLVRLSRDKRHIELVPIKAIKKKDVFERLNKGGYYLPGAVLWDYKFEVRGSTPDITADLRVVAAMCRAARRQEELRETPQKPKQPKKKVEEVKTLKTGKGKKTETPKTEHVSKVKTPAKKA